MTRSINQAKRWSDGSVGRKELQSFAGALKGQKAQKGIFITTAMEFVKGAVGETYQVKKMNYDFFEEF
jgi:restriction endonuclease Mrr